MNFALVSMVILVYENLENLRGAIDSVLEQDYPELELILSDDCSRYFPAAELRQYIEDKKRGNIKRVVVQTMPENLGTVRHANAAAAQANGEYIRFLGTDDVLNDPFVIRDTVAYMEETGSLLSTSQTAAYDEHLTRFLYVFPSNHQARQMNALSPEKLFGELVVHGNIVGAPGVIFRNEFFQQGGFDQTYRLTEDYPTWLRLSRERIGIPCMQRVTVKYRTNGVSSEKNKKRPVGQVLFSELGKVFEKEILPYTNVMTPFQHRYSKFVYNRVTNFDRFPFIKKLFFLCQYADIVIWRKYSALSTKAVRWFDGISAGNRTNTNI